MKQLKLCVEAEELDTIFSRIRPRGDTIKSLDSQSSGPVSFMGIYDAVCQTIASSGHRRELRWVVCASIIQTLESSCELSETQIDLLDSMLASVSLTNSWKH